MSDHTGRRVGTAAGANGEASGPPDRGPLAVTAALPAPADVDAGRAVEDASPDGAVLLRPEREEG